MAAVVAAGSLKSCLNTRVAASSQDRTARKRSGVKAGMRRLSLHGGLKAQNQLMAMGSSSSTEQQFAELRARCSARSGLARGGAAASTCDIASEIFTIVPIMSGLVLIGIALGFVLLRVEAAIEESE